MLIVKFYFKDFVSTKCSLRSLPVFKQSERAKKATITKFNLGERQLFLAASPFCAFTFKLLKPPSYGSLQKTRKSSCIRLLIIVLLQNGLKTAQFKLVICISVFSDHSRIFAFQECSSKLETLWLTVQEKTNLS